MPGQQQQQQPPTLLQRLMSLLPADIKSHLPFASVTAESTLDANRVYVESFNAREALAAGYRLALNHMAHLDHDTFAATRLGLRKNKVRTVVVLSAVSYKILPYFHIAQVMEVISSN